MRHYSRGVAGRSPHEAHGYQGGPRQLQACGRCFPKAGKAVSYKDIPAESAPGILCKCESLLAKMREQEKLVLALRYQALRSLYPDLPWARNEHLEDAYAREPAYMAWARWKRAEKGGQP